MKPAPIDLNEGGGALCRLNVGKALYGANRATTTDQLFVGDATGFSEFATGRDVLELQWNQGSSYPGEIRARHETDLAFRVSGKIQSRWVDPGTIIKMFDILGPCSFIDISIFIVVNPFISFVISEDANESISVKENEFSFHFLMIIPFSFKNKIAFTEIIYSSALSSSFIEVSFIYIFIDVLMCPSP